MIKDAYQPYAHNLSKGCRQRQTLRRVACEYVGHVDSCDRSRHAPGTYCSLSGLGQGYVHVTSMIYSLERMRLEYCYVNDT